MHTTIIRITIILATLNLQANLFAQAQKQGRIIVEITHIQNENGDVKITVHNKAEAFPNNHALSVARTTSEISGTTIKAVFDSIPYGEYAISILHDENGNGIMDSNWVGIPQEGYGASNDAPAKMGPPKYEDAKFTLDKPELNLKIKMVYF
jgi:uncharacterized protein (DUF2141 family)